MSELASRIAGGRILELGSGPGVDAACLESCGVSVIRTDATQAFVDLLRADGVQAEQLNAVTDDLGGPYDAIYAGAMLLHLDKAQFEAVARKALRAARVLAFTVKEGKGEAWTNERLDVPRFFKYWRAETLSSALSAAGWQVDFVRQVAGARDDWLYVMAHRP